MARIPACAFVPRLAQPGHCVTSAACKREDQYNTHVSATSAKKLAPWNKRKGADAYLDAGLQGILVVVVERQLARQQDVQDDAHSPHVNRGDAIRIAGQHLGRHVVLHSTASQRISHFPDLY
jgi:hypothetical protein